MADRETLLHRLDLVRMTGDATWKDPRVRSDVEVLRAVRDGLASQLGKKPAPASPERRGDPLGDVLDAARDADLGTKRGKELAEKGYEMVSATVARFLYSKFSGGAS